MTLQITALQIVILQIMTLQIVTLQIVTLQIMINYNKKLFKFLLKYPTPHSALSYSTKTIMEKRVK